MKQDIITAIVTPVMILIAFAYFYFSSKKK